VRVVPVGKKLSMIEQWCHEQSCLFQRGGYRNESYSPEKFVMGSRPSKGCSYSSETKHNRSMAPRPKFFVWKRRRYHKLVEDKVIKQRSERGRRMKVGKV
jgi:hypothetical protein